MNKYIDTPEKQDLVDEFIRLFLVYDQKFVDQQSTFDALKVAEGEKTRPEWMTDAILDSGRAFKDLNDYLEVIAQRSIPTWVPLQMCQKLIP